MLGNFCGIAAGWPGRKVCCLAVTAVSLMACLIAPWVQGQAGGQELGEVELREIRPSKAYPNAIVPGKLRFACAEREAVLAAHFRGAGIPFERALLRREGAAYCHIRFEPTLKGFRTLPDSAPLRGLILDVDPLSLLSQRRTQHGDSLDVAKTILPRIPESIEVTLGVAGELDKGWLAQALAFHFPRTPRATQIRDSRVGTGNAWAQDYMKSGSRNGVPVRLVTRLAFEGRSENGSRYKPMLDGLKDKQTVRSNLSWEGGDLQIHENPSKPGHTILFHGDVARGYWGEALTPQEYSYVLRLEFGVDETADFSELVPHVDYFLSVLPEDKIALISEPMQGNVELARHAARFLKTTFGETAAIQRLTDALGEPGTTEAGDLRAARKALGDARAEAANWMPSVNDEVYQRIAAYRESHCPEDATACLNGKRLNQLLASNMQLLRAWVNTTMQVRAAEFLPTAMLSVIESQLSEEPFGGQARIEAKVAELEGLGYRVVRVPRIGGDQTAKEPWSGISYANASLIGRTLFVPAFGFGEAEQAIFDDLQAKLKGTGYAVVPIYARYALLQNGGIHCMMAFVRDVPIESSMEPSAASGD